MNSICFTLFCEWHFPRLTLIWQTFLQRTILMLLFGDFSFTSMKMTNIVLLLIALSVTWVTFLFKNILFTKNLHYIPTWTIHHRALYLDEIHRCYLITCHYSLLNVFSLKNIIDPYWNILKIKLFYIYICLKFWKSVESNSFIQTSLIKNVDNFLN